MGPNTRPIRFGIAALVLFGLITAGTFAIVQARDATITSLNPAATNTPGPPTTHGMMGNGMMGHGMMGSTNLSDPYDLRFLDEMIVHHEMAIGMVQMMISQSTHPELRDLGQRIITGQQQQIDQMTVWRQQWYPNAPPLSGGMMGNGTTGMMGRGMMHGDFADRMFLTLMIPHHQRAIDMGNDALGNALHPDLKGLAKDIIAVQSAEITEMRGYLAAWYGITT
jgi:uncharacterized protein (DUF305 family)